MYFLMSRIDAIIYFIISLYKCEIRMVVDNYGTEHHTNPRLVPQFS